MSVLYSENRKTVNVNYRGNIPRDRSVVQVVNEMQEQEVEQALQVAENMAPAKVTKKQKRRSKYKDRHLSLKLRRFKENSGMIDNTTSHIFTVKSKENGRKFCGVINFWPIYVHPEGDFMASNGFPFYAYVDRSVPWSRMNHSMNADSFSELIRFIETKYEILELSLF
ncbi:hypothetical protein [Methanobacterium spitsbergense]|uniref:Uncharacterized protein n=1 Tax=Methanobacterium spitsbergense TaxID=2874285 RepID=A0A8T5UQW5_9EURY|nr:hypothetical protein [Methanobacterium spitsbergense]MBZ2166372.1 hypothetical protein [Methanobacterium spitsbergense]